MFDLECFRYLHSLIREKESIAQQKEVAAENLKKEEVKAQPKPVKPKKQTEKKAPATSVQEDKFQKDIQALCTYSSDFKNAWEQKHPLTFSIGLHELYSIIPRSARKKDRYDSLLNYLKVRGIQLIITSEKG